jgi:hypothetical protein
MKQPFSKKHWNVGKGEANSKNFELQAFNSYLQEKQGKLAKHYRELQIENRPLTAAAVKTAFLGIEKEKSTYSLL